MQRTALSMLCRYRVSDTLPGFLFYNLLFPTALNGLALCHSSMGCHSEAEEMSRKCLATYRQCLPESHPDIGTGMYTTAAASKQPKPCRTHADVLLELGNLGDYCQSQGKLDEAEQLLKDAIKAQQTSLPLQHPRIIQSK